MNQTTGLFARQDNKAGALQTPQNLNMTSRVTTKKDASWCETTTRPKNNLFSQAAIKTFQKLSDSKAGPGQPDRALSPSIIPEKTNARESR